METRRKKSPAQDTFFLARCSSQSENLTRILILVILLHLNGPPHSKNENVKNKAKKFVFMRRVLCQLVKFLDAKNTSFTVTYLAKTSDKEGFTLSTNSQNSEIISPTDLSFKIFYK